MKLHALMIAAALALGSTFALAANEGAGMGPNGASAAASHATMSARHMKKVSMRHLRRHHRRLHARAERRAERRERMASRESTRMMGAGRYGPSVNLNAPSRERRMDSAYDDWLRSHGRR